MREEIERRLAAAHVVAGDPSTVFCVQPFELLERDGGERLGRLLARVMADPDQALIVATKSAFVFAFGNQLEPVENVAIRHGGVSEG
jgi:hypothetical protein